MSHAPAHALERAGLDGGEETKIELSEPVARLALTGLDHRRAIEAGRVTLNAGFTAEDMRATSEVEITDSFISLCARPRAAGGATSYPTARGPHPIPLSHNRNLASIFSDGRKKRVGSEDWAVCGDQSAQ